MHPDGSGERILSEGWFVEGPTFAPNGRVLMFWRETRRGHARGQRLLLAAGFDRHHRLQRACGADADRRVRSGLVAAGSVSRTVPQCDIGGKICVRATTRLVSGRIGSRGT